MAEPLFSQNSFNVESFARQILSEIEKIRSVDKNFDDSVGTGYLTPNESRVNAFFRLVGLPMILELEAKDKKQNADLKSGVVTPGYGHSFCQKLSKYNIKNKKEAELANRNSDLISVESRIGTDEMNANMVRALKNFMPIAANVDFVSEFNSVKSAQDSSAVTAAAASASAGVNSGSTTVRGVYKRLKPLVTMYIKDGVSPKYNELARPFLLNYNEQTVDNETYLSKPLIETIIRIRFINSMSAGDEQQKKLEKDFLDTITSFVGSKEDFESVFKNPDMFFQTSLLEQLIIEKFLFSLDELTNRWCHLENSRNKLFNKIPFNIAIKTDSSKQNVFGKRIYIDSDSILQENTEYGNSLKAARKKFSNSEAMLSLLPTDDVVNSGSSNRAVTQNASSTALQSVFTSIVSAGMEDAKKEISEIESKISKSSAELEELRVNVEVLTGEFLGISLFDVVVVIAALFLIKKENLLYLLDSDVISDINKNIKIKDIIKAGESSLSNTMTAISELEKTVDQLYDLINFMIGQWKGKNRSRKKKK